MLDFKTKMRCEIEQIPAALQTLIERSDKQIKPLARSIRQFDPALVCTLARGSSDHAATYLKYAFELTHGIPVASIAPSINSIYARSLKLDRSLCLAISQSGASPDIVGQAYSVRSGGALTIALTNEVDSDLAAACQFIVNIDAGIEESVAATKTFVASIAAGLILLAHWVQDKSLFDALRRLPDQVNQALEMDWEPLIRNLLHADRLFVLGRGPAVGIANEAALKFKETCRIQAEAFSSAEVLHGPVSVLSANSSILAMVARDRAETSIVSVADDLAQNGASVFATSDKAAKAVRLPFFATGHPLTDPLALVVSFYACVEKLSRLRGLNPNQPRSLKKVTATL